MEMERQGHSFYIFVSFTLSNFKVETCSLQQKNQLNQTHQEIGFGML
jgi:hypothetical protein